MARERIDYVAHERIGQLARTYWLPCAKTNEQRPFLSQVMEQVYVEELLTSGFSHRHCLALELNQYLEQWLWPNFDCVKSSRAHVLSICVMVNEKARGRVPIWQIFTGFSDKFHGLLDRVLHILVDESAQILSLKPNHQPLLDDAAHSASRKCILEHIVLITFLSHCFTNLAEVGVLRQCLRGLYSLSIWTKHVGASRLAAELQANPHYSRLTRKLAKYEATKLDADERIRLDFEHGFVPRMVDVFLDLLLSIPEKQKEEGKRLEPLLIHYLERFILLLIDLQSMLLTRRVLNVLLDDRHVVIHCQASPLVRRLDGKLFAKLVDSFVFYSHFQIDESTGNALDDGEVDKRHCVNLSTFQLKAYGQFKDKMKSFAVLHLAGIETPQMLRKHLSNLTGEELVQLGLCFGLVNLAKDKTTTGEDNHDDNDNSPRHKRARLEMEVDGQWDKLRLDLDKRSLSKDVLIKIMINRFAKRQSELEHINSLALYPTEDLIWDENRVPVHFYSDEDCLALPKLGLQFLTLQDYLLRNFHLFRLESTHAIRQDIEDAMVRLRPWRGEFGQTIFDGWCRMALPIQSFVIVEVAKPALGSKHPSRIRADVRVALSGLKWDVRREWLGLRRHDPVFLVTVRSTKNRGWKFNSEENFLSQINVQYIRGCEIEGQVDKEGKLVPDEERLGFVPNKGEKANLVDTLPTWRVHLDPAQYQFDLDQMRAEQKRAEVLRSKLVRAKREGRPAEDIQALESLIEQAAGAQPEDLYDTFNILVRRKPKKNNFKAVLDTIRDLMNTRSVVPDWLLDLLMGYLDPAAAHYSHRPDHYEVRQNWFDTFIDAHHLTSALNQYDIRFVDKRQSTKWSRRCTGDDDDLPPPYRLIFPSLADDPTARVEAMFSSQFMVPDGVRPIKASAESSTPQSKPVVVAEAYDVALHPPHNLLPKGHVRSVPGNQIPFTPVQVEAIRSGMQPGLTLVVGPPGTGKTDVAVQIIHNLYHNYPSQRILIVTHSNQALNQLFEKIIGLNVDERHLLRLGHGEEGLSTDKDFSRYGRVDYILTKRIQLLQEVMRLARTFNQSEDEPKPAIEPENDGMLDIDLDLTDQSNFHLHTCETAQYFYVQEVLSRWELFVSHVASSTPQWLQQTDQQPSNGMNDESPYDPDLIRKHFPFIQFFTRQKNPSPEVVQKLFPGRNFLEDMALARSYFIYLHNIFTQLDEFRAFELMRTGTERSNYLLVQEARIIAMTCTYAALRRRDLIQLGFSYDTILMEEAAQILEIETFIPLLLQNPDISGRNRLKRWIMIGDHHQLPPVVNNQAFNNYSNMGQSLFTRLVKLGVPTVQLDAQGRARPSLSRLYSWRYDRLLNLDHTVNNIEFRLANPGFRFDVQLVNVEAFKGIGESEPSAYFFQNLAEAEYVVAVYMYMRMIGYPADKITILTTYNGQKHLIRDVVAARCANNPLLGEPSMITTVDRFQGQQNDYILVSLVRTRTVGHLRDVRRLVVSLSRARLGLYIFARIEQFANCPELKPAFDLILNRTSNPNTMKPTELHLTPWESWTDPRVKNPYIKQRYQSDPLPQPAVVIKDMPHMSNFAHQLYNERLEQLTAQLSKETKQKEAATKLAEAASKTILPTVINDPIVEPLDVQKMEVDVQETHAVEEPVADSGAVGGVDNDENDGSDAQSEED